MTKFKGCKSTVLPITASVVQGSAVGPFCFIASATGLRPIHPGNEMTKYADDSYLIIPGNNSLSIPSELEHITAWANANNLKLNVGKTQELIIYGSYNKKKNPPPLLPGLTRVHTLSVLGVTIDEMLSFSDHISMKLSKGHQQLYAIKTLKAHGLAGVALNDVCNAVFLSSLTYASQAWWGFISAESKHRLQACVSKTKTWKLDGGKPLNDIELLCTKYDNNLFKAVLNDPHHVLHKLLPETKTNHYNMRDRAHNKTLAICTTVAAKTFINRMLFSYKL